MFSDSLWPNVILFVLAQVVAWGFLRTGLLVRGMALMASAWIGADVALLARFVWGETGVVFWLPLVLFQVHTVVEGVLFAFGRWRRRTKAIVVWRREVFREAFLHYLKDELEPARIRWRRLVWSDPWDLESKLGWATVLVRQGRRNRARMLLTHARWLDRDEKFRDVIDEELQRCRVASKKAVGATAVTAKQPAGDSVEDPAGDLAEDSAKESVLDSANGPVAESAAESSNDSPAKVRAASPDKAESRPPVATERVRAVPAKPDAAEASPKTEARPEPAVTIRPAKPPETPKATPSPASKGGAKPKRRGSKRKR